MKSEVRLFTPSLKFTFTVGILATVIILVLSFTYRVQVAFILGGIGMTVTGFGLLLVGSRGLSLYRQYQLSGIEVSKEQQKLNLIKYQTQEQQLKATVLTFPKTHRVVMLEEAGVRMIEGVSNPVDAQGVAIPQQPETLPHLLDIIGNETSVVFRGPKRSGKTYSAMQWLAGRGKCIVVDPKNEGVQVNRWPSGCKVVSCHSRTLTAIEIVLDLMHKRRKQGATNRQPVTIFFDELQDLVTRLEIDVIPVVLEIATLGAEFNVFSAFTTHAQTTKYLGLEAASLLANFTIVRTSRIGNEYKTFVDLGDGEFPVNNFPRGRVGGGESVEILRGGVGGQPPLHHHSTTPPTPPTPPHHSTTPLHLSTPTHPLTRDVLRLWDSGSDIATICKQLLGDRNIGGNQYKRIKRILAANGREFEKVGES